MLQIGVYGGLRISEIAALATCDIVATEHQSSSNTTTSYSVRVRCGKNSKTRLVSLKKSVGLNIWTYAQSLTTKYLFPSPRNSDTHMHSQSLGCRLKRLFRKIGQPQGSAHFLRHYFASSSCHNGMDIASIQAALGHSSIHTTSVYMHASKHNVSEVIDLSGPEGSDITIVFQKSVVKISEEDLAINTSNTNPKISKKNTSEI